MHVQSGIRGSRAAPATATRTSSTPKQAVHQESILYALACELARNDKWMLFLNAADGPAFLEISHSFDRWQRFMADPDATVLAERNNLMYFPAEPSTLAAPPQEDADVASRVAYPTLLAFRIRAMLADYRLQRIQYANTVLDIALSPHSQSTATNNNVVGVEQNASLAKNTLPFAIPRATRASTRNPIFDISLANVRQILAKQQPLSHNNTPSQPVNGTEANSIPTIANNKAQLAELYPDLQDFFVDDDITDATSIAFSDQQLIDTLESTFTVNGPQMGVASQSFFGQHAFNDIAPTITATTGIVPSSTIIGQPTVSTKDIADIVTPKKRKREDGDDNYDAESEEDGEKEEDRNDDKKVDVNTNKNAEASITLPVFASPKPSKVIKIEDDDYDDNADQDTVAISVHDTTMKVDEGSGPVRKADAKTTLSLDFDTSGGVQLMNPNENDGDAAAMQSERLKQVRIDSLRATKVVDVDDAYYTIDDFQTFQLLTSTASYKRTLLDNGTGLYTIPGTKKEFEELRKTYHGDTFDLRRSSRFRGSKHGNDPDAEAAAAKKAAEEKENAKLKKLGNQVHSSFRHLYMKLYNQLEENGTTAEVRKILCDLRPTRSKWWDEYRVGQDRLYDHLEQMLEALKAVPQHARPFLKPVTLKEAPTYFDVIKKPMDLSTMEKKLHNREYLSKQQFADDAYLIWSNCVTFSPAPNDPLRKAAGAMKRRTTEQLKKVPDITIKVLPRPETSPTQEKLDVTTTTDKSGDKSGEDSSRDPQSVPTMTRSSTIGSEAEGSILEDNEGNRATVNKSTIGISKASHVESAASIVSTMDETASGMSIGPDDTRSIATNDVDDDPTATSEVYSEKDTHDNQDDDEDEAVEDTTGDYVTVSKSGTGNSRKPTDSNNPQSSDVIEVIATESDIASSRWRAEIWRESDEPAVKSIVSNIKPTKKVSIVDDNVISIPGIGTPKEPKSFGERPAIVRDFGRMREYLDQTKESRERALLYFKNWKQLLEQDEKKDQPANKPKNAKSPPTPKSKAPSKADLTELSVKISKNDNSTEIPTKPSLDLTALNTPFLPEINYFNDSVPAIVTPAHNYHPFANSNKSQRKGKRRSKVDKTLPSLSDYPEIIAGPSRGVIARSLSEMIFELKLIKEVHSQILQAEASNSTKPAVDSKGNPIEPPKDIGLGSIVHDMYKPQTAVSDLPPLFLNEESAQACLRQTVASILLSAGFEQVLDSTLSVFLDVVKDQFLRLGKTLRTFVDAKGREWSNERILLRTLYENGLDQYILDEFIKNDILKQTMKTRELRLKLVYAYSHMMNLVNDDDGMDAIERDDAAERIMSGNFMEELGVDFLNLRDFGLEFLNVPANLWNKKSEKQIRARLRYRVMKQSDMDGSSNSASVFEFKKFKPIDVNKSIGLLRDFYKRKVTEQKEEFEWLISHNLSLPTKRSASPITIDGDEQSSDPQQTKAAEDISVDQLCEDSEKDPSVYVLKAKVLMTLSKTGRRQQVKIKDVSGKRKKKKKVAK